MDNSVEIVYASWRCIGWREVKGKNWDNCKSINNKTLKNKHHYNINKFLIWGLAHNKSYQWS